MEGKLIGRLVVVVVGSVWFGVRVDELCWGVCVGRMEKRVQLISYDSGGDGG